MLHTISIHVCYSFILSASMYITFAPDHQPWLLQLHTTIFYVFHNCTKPAVMSVKPEPTNMPCLILWHRTSIHICYSNIQPSVWYVALAPGQYSSNGYYNCTGSAGLYCKLHPTTSQDGNEHLQHADILLLDLFFVLIHYTL